MLSGAVLLSSSCASLIGADEELGDAADRLCACIMTFPTDLRGAFGSRATCARRVSGRLKAGDADARERWLANFVARCESCNKAPEQYLAECYYGGIACSVADCANNQAAECCSRRCDAQGLCED